MKITAILGSPRANGNTDILAEKILSGAAESGWETETIPLRKLKMSLCNGCEMCWKNGSPCIHKDDIIALYDKIAGSDVLVFATPVYWYAPTSLMKILMDRMVPFNRPQGRPLITGKGAILVTAYEEEGPEPVEPLLQMFKLSLNYLNLKYLGKVVVDGVGSKGAVLNKPQELEHAYQIGRNLTSLISEAPK